jgi:hypothetical protein
MKTLAVCLCAVLVMGLASSASAAQKLQHVVCLKFKTSAPAAEVTKVEEAFRALKKKISQITALEWGTNVSKEQRDKGFTHCFIVTFKTEKDRDTYIDHPEHKAFVGILGPVLDDVFVIDFWAKE